MLSFNVDRKYLQIRRYFFCALKHRDGKTKNPIFLNIFKTLTYCMKRLNCLYLLVLMSLSTVIDAQIWISTVNQNQIIERSESIRFQKGVKPGITINPEVTFQPIDGFGYTLTGGSADVINALNPKKKSELLQELFGNQANGMHISVLRIGIGSTDLDTEVYSYADVASDRSLRKFSLDKAKKSLIPLLKEIKAIQPNIKLLASPWSPPAWMKDNQSTQGGSLLPENNGLYAAYIVKYIQAMAKEGLAIWAITPQNEPLHPGNNPSLLMTADQQNDWIKNHLGPAFVKNNITTQIIIYDHNCDKPEYPISILNDPETRKFVSGSAFHLYNGDISALSTVKKAHPDKAVYFTEQWTGAKGEFAGDFMWHIQHVVIGALNNDAQTVLEWNLANDTNFGPHTPGGCTECKGAITIESDGNIIRNQAYYIIKQASAFIPVGSKRIEIQDVPAELHATALQRPDKSIILLLQNDTKNSIITTVNIESKYAEIEVPAKSVVQIIHSLL